MRVNVTIECPGGHEFELPTDVRDYVGIPLDTKHHGIVCPTCGERVGIAVGKIIAVAARKRERVAAADVEVGNAPIEIDPDLKSLMPIEIEKNPDGERTGNKKYTVEEREARRALGSTHVIEARNRGRGGGNG